MARVKVFVNCSSCSFVYLEQSFCRVTTLKVETTLLP